MWYPCGMESHLEREVTCRESKVTRRETLRGLSSMEVKSICMEQQKSFQERNRASERSSGGDSRNGGSVWEGLRGVRRPSRLVASRPTQTTSSRWHEQSFPFEQQCGHEQPATCGQQSSPSTKKKSFFSLSDRIPGARPP